jgi:hypothetical protein
MGRDRQSGLTILGWVAILTIVGAVATLAIRIIPHYTDFYTIVRLVEELPANQVHAMDKASIRESLLKRFLINNIRDLNVRDVIEIERKRDATEIVVHYERREHIVYNVDLVLTFDRRFEFK